MSNAMKKTGKSKFLTEELEDFIKGTKYTKEPKPRKSVKRESSEVVEEEISEDINHYQPSPKKNKGDVDTGKLVRGKLVNVMEHQISARKRGNEILLKNMSELITQIKTDNAALKSNQQKVTTALVKCMDQVSAAQDQKLSALNDIYNSFKKQCEEMESHHKADAAKLADELEADIQKLQQKLVSETKRSGWETLRKTIFHAMQNDF